jgi:hypothetical protein
MMGWRDQLINFLEFVVVLQTLGLLFAFGLVWDLTRKARKG